VQRELKSEAMMGDRSDRIGQAGWVVLPLRAFLAVVFLYGGISKIADTRFLNDSSPSSMNASVLAVKSSSPIGGFLGPVADHSFAFGLVMALAELAVGLGVLLGLWTRIAAAGGMLLALSLWLTVSWGATPWFTSADLVYLFAFTPLLIAGSAGVLSLDAWLATAVVAHPGRSEDHTRRALVTGAAAVVGLVVVGAASLARKSTPSRPVAAGGGDPPTPTASSTATTTTIPTTTAATTAPTPTKTLPTLAKVADVPVGGGKEVTDPVSGDPAWVLQLAAGTFTAFSAVCPHQQCAVRFVSAKDGFACPCHSSQFTAAGKLRQGPATRGLTPITVEVIDGVVKRG